MRIAFLSQMGFSGKVPRTHDNMRVEFAQMCALNADHFPLYDLHPNRNQVPSGYDHIILLIPKTPKDRENLYDIDVVSLAKNKAKKVWFMQEGPAWIFQDMPLHHQFWHYKVLTDVDGILTENKTDISYFKGLVPNKKITDIPSVMIEDSIKDALSVEKQDKAIIGGNFCRWYGGFDSYIVAQEFEVPLFVPSMGRKIEGEEQIEGLTHLPYMNWKEWIYKLAEFKYAVHLMPTIAAGTFAMNCAYLGIPCVGYKDADTQSKLHPQLGVDIGDIESARKLCNKLKNDTSFYEHQSEVCKNNYHAYHSEEQFVKDMKKLKEVLNG